MKKQVEIWRDIPGYEGIYQCSNLGRVKSLDRFDDLGRFTRGKLKSVTFKSKGYLKCSLNKSGIKKTIPLHKIIAITFLNHTPCGMALVVDHINNIKTDNRASNLQLISNRENTAKHDRKCSSKYTGVCWDKSRSKWISTIYINGKLKNLGRYDSEYSAHLEYQKALHDVTKKD